MYSLTLSNKLKTILIVVVAAFGIFGLAGSVSAADTDVNGDGVIDSQDDACEALIAIGDNSCATGGAETKIDSAIAAALNILSYIVGIASVIVIIVAGLRFILSGGDPKGVQAARGSIIYAAIGLAVVILAQVIVRYVIGKVG